MHFHAEHPLFFARGGRPLRSGAPLALALAVLLLNAGLGSVLFSVSCAAVGLGLLWRAGLQGRVAPLLAWVGVVVVGVATAAVWFEGRAVWALGARVVCGVVWGLWLGTQVDWSALCQLLLAIGVPKQVVGVLDQALLHGLLTRGEWARRRDAARLRLGRARLPFQAWGAVLAEGAVSALERLDVVTDNAALRAAPAGTASSQGGLVALDQVAVVRGERLLLGGLQLQLAAGEWLAVCGPSGAGKSTLLRLLAGLEAPSSGRMLRLGKSIGPLAALSERLDGRVGLLCQNPEHHFIASTVVEDMAWGLRQRGVADSDAVARCQNLAQALGVAELLGRPCHQLSFGEQRRVALAGVLVLEPALLLLDEPTAGLDPVAALRLIQQVRRVVTALGTACVWATHDLSNLPPEVSRMLLISGQTICFDGPVAEGLSQAWLCRAGLASAAED